MSKTNETQSAVKINVAPIILTTVLCTVAAVGGGYYLSKLIEGRRDKREEEKAREQESMGGMPPMPMMFGGFGQTRTNDESKRMLDKVNEALQRQEKYESRLDGVMNRINEWEHSLATREHHLRLVSGGDDYGSDDDE